MHKTIKCYISRPYSVILFLLSSHFRILALLI